MAYIRSLSHLQHPRYESEQLSDITPFSINSIGNSEILDKQKTAFFCSIKCPGEIILKLHEFVQKLTNVDIAVMSGFHSPVEKGVLDMLLRRKHPVIICPARSLKNIRIPRDWKQGIEKGWILLVSPFDKKHKRMTAELAEKRNRFIAGQTDEVLIAHANKGGKLERFAFELIKSGKSVCTFESEWNRGLIERGAKDIKGFLKINDHISEVNNENQHNIRPD